MATFPTPLLSLLLLVPVTRRAHFEYNNNFVEHKVAAIGENSAESELAGLAA